MSSSLIYVEIRPGPDARAHGVFADMHRAVHLSIVEQGPVLAVDYPLAAFSKIKGERIVKNGYIGDLMRVFSSEEECLRRLLGRNDVSVLIDTEGVIVGEPKRIDVVGTSSVEWVRSRDRDQCFSPSRLRRELARGRVVTGPKRLRSTVGLELYSYSTRQRMSLQMLRREHPERTPQLGTPNSYGLSSGSTFLPVIEAAA